MKDKFSRPWVSSGLWHGPSPRSLWEVLIIACSGNSEGGHKIFPLVLHLNVNFKNMNPPYPYISSAIQLSLGEQGTEVQKNFSTLAIVRCQNRDPTRYTTFSQPHPFPHLIWCSEKMGEKMQSLPSPLPAMFFKTPWKQPNLQQKDGWACSLLQFAVHCLSTWRAGKLGWDKQPLTAAPGSPGKVPFRPWREKLYGQLSLSTGRRLLFVAQRKYAVP